MRRKIDLLKTFLCILCLLAFLPCIACGEAEVVPPAEPPAEEGWRHRVTNTEILETETFLDAPDSAVYYNGSFEAVTELSAEEAVALHGAFNGMQVGFHGRRAYHGFFTVEALEEQIAAHGGIEFRYDQRRRYVGEPLRYEAVGGRGTESWDPGEKGAFDAMLVIPVGDKGFLIIPYLDGAYNETVSHDVCYAAFQYGPFGAAWEEILGTAI